uniref:SH2 domain-containing protein n=1 Tax=Panagrolaimus sp. PS1159 TaxID=55785 RepID=A0AC35FVS9_9BILA
MLRDKKIVLSKIQESENEVSPKKEPELEFDEKLGEFVFPIGEFMNDQLQRLAYFCNNPNKFEVYAILSQMPEGAFLLRYSESRRRCLALSVRVPDSYDDSKISHYLIIRNQQGFRLKGSQRFFSSLPMLITHHTVLPELLPCRLIFVEWDKNLLRGKTAAPPTSTTTSSSYGTPIPLGYHENQYSSPPRILNLSQSPHKKHARRSFELYQD